MAPGRPPLAYPFKMSELWVRLALVAGVVAIGGAIALIGRRRARQAVSIVRAPDLDPGFYFFSSTSCTTCEQARAKLDTVLGPGGYKEFAWEEHPEAFTEYSVDQVPALMVVDHSRRGRLHLGQPDRALVLE
jgi:hypothetical protein